MLVASCHCGAVRIEVPRKPRTLTRCNCSLCRRYAVWWAYYPPESVRIVAKRGAMSAYAWGRKAIRFIRCKTCGCVTHYQRVVEKERTIGVNARNFDPLELGSPRIRTLDGAATWRYLD